MTGVEEQQKTVSQMYNLINTYSGPTPLDVLYVFGTLQTSIDSLEDLIDEADYGRASLMDKFCSSLHKDIEELNSEVWKVLVKVCGEVVSANASISTLKASTIWIKYVVWKVFFLCSRCFFVYLFAPFVLVCLVCFHV